MVVLGAELEVAEDDGDLGAGDDEDDEDEAQEAEEVVELVQPHAGQDEEQLDEDRAERQNAADEHAEGRVHVPRLQWHPHCSMLMHEESQLLPHCTRIDVPNGTVMLLMDAACSQRQALCGRGHAA